MLKLYGPIQMYLMLSARRRTTFTTVPIIVMNSSPAGDEVTLVGCYHVSPHNTYTGRLTPQMLDDVLASLGP